MHQLGNHGPAYYRRYPIAFEQIKPACHTNKLEQCSKEELDNAYDNAIRYTDYFILRAIGILKKNSKNFEASLIYISDHGESLGEHGMYLRGLLYIIAPAEQKHVPMIMWFSDSFDLKAEVDYPGLLKIKNLKFSHDNLPHTLLGLFEIEVREYDRKKDIINHVPEHHNAKIKTASKKPLVKHKKPVRTRTGLM